MSKILNLRAQSCQRNRIQHLLQGYFLRQSTEGVKLDASDLRILGYFPGPQNSWAIKIPIVASNWCSKTFYETDKKVFFLSQQKLAPLDLHWFQILTTAVSLMVMHKKLLLLLIRVVDIVQNLISCVIPRTTDT